MLPIPASAPPSSVTTAPNVSYADSNSSGVMVLAKATTNFALRFSGELRAGRTLRIKCLAHSDDVCVRCGITAPLYC